MDLYAPPFGGPPPPGEPAEKERVPRQGALSPLPGIWQGRLDSNQRVRESKSLALPLGYVPMEKAGTGARPDPLHVGVGDGTRTHDTRNHNPVL